MRLLTWLPLGIVLLSCISCGKKGQDRAPWPAVVINISGMSDTKKTSIRSSIQNLNEQLGVSAVSEGEQSNQYAITIHEVPPPSGNQDRERAVLAIFDNETCDIQISQTVFDKRPKLLEAVLWHELGHCAGLLHDGTEGELMYSSTSVDGHYSPEAIQRFLKAFASAANISVK